MITAPVISKAGYDPHLLRLVSRVIAAIGVVFILLFGANEIGIPALGLLAGASVGGLVIGLAAQSTVENLIGGMTLFADKPFEVGDFVGFGPDRGTVELIGPRSTRIRKLDGTRLTVPNSDIVQARISNYTRRNNALFLHTIGLRYETTLEQIEWLVAQIREGLRDHPRVEQDDDMPRVRLAAFGASSIDIEVRAYVDTTDVHEFMAVQEQLLAMIMRLVEAAGTSIAFPSTTAYITRDDGIVGPAALAGAGATPANLPDRRSELGGVSRSVAGCQWRRGWDSNPRCFRTPLFESGTLNHSDTSPGASESSKGRPGTAMGRSGFARLRSAVPRERGRGAVRRRPPGGCPRRCGGGDRDCHRHGRQAGSLIGVGQRVDDAVGIAGEECPDTHGTGLDDAEDGGPGQRRAPQLGGRFAQGDDDGVRGGVPRAARPPRDRARPWPRRGWPPRRWRAHHRGRPGRPRRERRACRARSSSREVGLPLRWRQGGSRLHRTRTARGGTIVLTAHRT